MARAGDQGSESVLDRGGEAAAEGLVETRAVVEEALRLYPPVIGITRTTLRRRSLPDAPSSAARC